MWAGSRITYINYDGRVFTKGMTSHFKHFCGSLIENRESERKQGDGVVNYYHNQEILKALTSVVATEVVRIG